MPLPHKLFQIPGVERCNVADTCFCRTKEAVIAGCKQTGTLLWAEPNGSISSALQCQLDSGDKAILLERGRPIDTRLPIWNGLNEGITREASFIWTTSDIFQQLNAGINLCSNDARQRLM